MRYILMFAATLYLLAPASAATTTNSKASATMAANQSVDISAAKKVKSKRKPAPKQEYMRAVPSG